MKNRFSKKSTLIACIAAVVILVAGGIYWYVKSVAAPSFASSVVARGNVVESVTEPATVLAENNTNLSFEEGGTIAQVNVREGDVVSAGETLIALDQASLAAALQEASSSVAAAEAQLAELQAGTRPEQLAIDESAVTNAQAALGTDIESAYGAAADAVQNQTDNLFLNPTTNNPTFLVSSNDSQTVNNIESGRLSVGAALNAWYLAITTSTTDPASLAVTANVALQEVQSYINTIALVVNSATPSASLPSATLAAYKVDVSAARNEVSAAATAETAAHAALTNAINQLALANAGATPQAIEAQEAVVAQASAAVTAAHVALANASLKAPFNGTVQNLTAQVGQVVSPGTPLLSLVNNQGLKVQTYVSDTDVAKFQTGDAASVTLDAYGTGVVFPATVTTIDDSETQVNGSPAYQVILHFTKADGRLKDGLTGNVTIIAAEHDNVIEVPTRLIINSSNNYFVLVQKGTASVQEPVQIGIAGDNGMTEITSGLDVGDQLTNF